MLGGYEKYILMKNTLNFNCVALTKITFFCSRKRRRGSTKVYYCRFIQFTFCLLGEAVMRRHSYVVLCPPVWYQKIINLRFIHKYVTAPISEFFTITSSFSLRIWCVNQIRFNSILGERGIER